MRLDPAEQDYLFHLAGHRVSEIAVASKGQIAEPLQRMLRGLTEQPAYILDRRWNVLAWNRATEIVFGDYSTLVGDQCNTLHMLFGNPDHQRLLVDWDTLAPTALAMFRAENAGCAGDPDYQRLVSTLNERSTEFRDWWKKHDVLEYTSIHKRIEHRAAGRMVFEYNSFTADDRSGAKLVVYTSLEQNQTQQKMKELLRSPSP